MARANYAILSLENIFCASVYTDITWEGDSIFLIFDALQDGGSGQAALVDGMNSSSVGKDGLGSRSLRAIDGRRRRLLHNATTPSLPSLPPFLFP